MSAEPKPYTEQDLIDFFIDSARYGDTEDVQVALKEGVKLEVRDEGGRTALHMAAANGHLDIVKILIGAGADVNARNKQESTPLHWACLNGKLEIVNLLLKSGSNPSAMNTSGRTPVDEALSRDFTDIVKAINDHMGAPAVEIETDDVEPTEGDEVEEIGPDGAGPSGTYVPMGQAPQEEGMDEEEMA